MGQHAKLIDALFADKQDREIARAFVARFEGNPMMADRIEPLLREAARGDAMVRDGSMSRDQAGSYLLSFASDALGAPAHVVQEIQSWAPDPSLFPPDTSNAEQSQPATAAPSQSATATPTRDQLRAQIEQHRADMSSPERSEGWMRYWKGGGAAAYAEALRAMETAVDAPAVPTLAGGATAAAPPAEPAPTA